MVVGLKEKKIETVFFHGNFDWKIKLSYAWLDSHLGFRPLLLDGSDQVAVGVGLSRNVEVWLGLVGLTG